ncbi:MAG: AAA family ATPase, partial [Halobacteriaceae archaeon]
MEKHGTGVTFLDDVLNGGYEPEIVTTIYGPAGSGKTLLLLLAMRVSQEKILFVDTEGGFSTERFAQVCDAYREVLERTIFLNPTTFDQQEDAVEELEKLVDSMDVGLVLFDTFTALYRVNITQEDNYDLNKRLAKQLRTLVGIARDESIPVLTTTQVYTDIEDPEEYNVVGG